MTDGTTTWNYTYNSDGLRTSRSNGTTTYEYIYNGSTLVQMTVGDDTLYFGTGTVTYNGTVYYYATNLQGDVIAILDSAGTAVVEYTYDAWGNILSTTGSMANTLGAINPLRYRGYVFDQESGLYYLQSRYYNSKVGRFLNADALVSTGQGILGNNMFTYCLNNSVNGCDPCGTCMHYWYLLGLVDCDKCKEKSTKEKWEDFQENGLTAVFTTGGYVSANLGVFNASGSLEVAYDLKGNIQIVASGSFDVTSAGSLSLSGGRCQSAYIMPDTSYLAGDTYYGGGSVSVPVTPAVAVGVGGNIGQTSDGYWGVTKTQGVGTISAMGKELHGGYAKTWALTEQINVIDWIIELIL